MPRNITSLRLPPYSPELDPVENVRAFLRGNKPGSRLFAGYDAIVEACCDAGNRLIARPSTIKNPRHTPMGTGQSVIPGV